MRKFFRKSGLGAHIGLRRWVWSFFVKTAILPVVTVELVFFGINFSANMVAAGIMTDYMTDQANTQAGQVTTLEAQNLQKELDGVTTITQMLARETGAALGSPNRIRPEDESRVSETADGMIYSAKDAPEGGAAAFYSGIRPADQDIRSRISRILTVQAFMKDIKNTNPLISQVFFNSYDSLNVIYPYFDVLNRYSPRTDFTKFNYYYEADASHDPGRNTVWTGMYQDPSGHGWVTSCIAPVYNGDFLEGVVGVDITMPVITQQLADVKTPWGGYAMLVGKDGSIFSMPEEDEADFRLEDLVDKDPNTMSSKTFEPSEYNLYGKTGLEGFSGKIKSNASGTVSTVLNGKNKLASWDTVGDTGWKLIIIVPEETVYSGLNHIKWVLSTTGMTIVGSVILFYSLLFFVLYRRSRQMSTSLSEPLQTINEMAGKIGRGDYFQQAPDFNVDELRETSQSLAQMGKKLGQANSELLITQEKLREREAYLEAIVSSVDDTIIEMDEDGTLKNILKVDPALKGIRYLPGPTIQSLSILDKNSEDELLAKIKSAIQTGQPESIEYQIETPNGTRFRQARITSVQNARSATISVRDITERKEMEQSIVEARDLAEKASLAKSQFLSNMSHELRTPLNAVLGFSQVLGMDPEAPLTESQADCVHEIEKAGHHLLELINEILDLAKIESGKISLSIEPVAVPVIMKEALSLIKPMAENYGVKINIPENPCKGRFIFADKVRIKQVLINLLTNAIKYNKQNGIVDFYCSFESGRMYFHVNDTGLGIPGEEIEEIFKPFYRLNATKNVIEGTGIGLSMVQQLLKLMGGEINVESQVGVGSKFVVSLPLAPDPLDIGTVIPDQIEQDLLRDNIQAKTILYVEDNPSNLTLIERIMGYIPHTKLITAVSAEIGIDLARAHRPDVILMDINLPDMDGYEMLGRLHGYPETAAIPLIAVSANAMEKDIEYALALGFKDYITKPIHVSDFIDKMKRILLGP